MRVRASFGVGVRAGLGCGLVTMKPPESAKETASRYALTWLGSGLGFKVRLGVRGRVRLGLGLDLGLGLGLGLG